MKKLAGSAPVAPLPATPRKSLRYRVIHIADERPGESDSCGHLDLFFSEVKAEYQLKETRAGGNAPQNTLSKFLKAYTKEDIYLVTDVPAQECYSGVL